MTVTMSAFGDKFKKVFDTTDITEQLDPDDVRHNRLMAIFAYLPLLVLVPLFAAEKSEFARFHANQGLLVAILELFCWVVLATLIHVPVIGWLFRIIRVVLGILCVLYAILGILFVLLGMAKELPLIGKIRLLR